MTCRSPCLRVFALRKGAPCGPLIPPDRRHEELELSIMESQKSRRRRGPPTQEPPQSPKQVAPQPPPRPWLTWSLATVLLLGLTYFLRPDIYLTNWIGPLLGHGHLQGLADDIDQEATLRPRIELHPEHHVYRAPVTHYLDWRVTTGQRRPDGVLKEVFLINDLFPGPTIEARSGDTLVITVINSMTEHPVALHWHGLHVPNGVDGAAAVSQCPIAPGAQYVYNVSLPATQSGTFWYHAHAGVSRGDGLYGGLVVHAPASKSTVRGLMARGGSDLDRYGYDKELLLLIGDWYHPPAEDVLAWYKNPGNFGNEPVPDSLLVNGVGKFDCGMAVRARPLDCIPHLMDSSFLNLDPNRSYRIRVVNTGSLGGFSLDFDRENLELLQVDSVDVERSQQKDVNRVGILYPGQRMDFVLRPSAKEGKGPSSMMVELDQECFKYMNPALTPDQLFPIYYNGISDPDRMTLVPSIRNKLNIQEIPSSASILATLPEKADETHVVYTKIQKMARNNNSPYGYFNMTTWKPQSDPLVPLIALPRENWDANQFSLTTGPGSRWVDLVVNNLDEGPHPFHLHGHHFFILAIHESTFGWGSYNPFEDPVPTGFDAETDPAQPYDLSRAALRDTVQIPSRGYAVLRFRADNPGIWLFHCHILWHLATGMAMLIDVQGDPAGLVAHDASVLPAGEICPPLRA
ncbi:multicopper oxidase-domain-containing protein [Penicillium argentinense]|uniref:Multicopper oxidase-domain-containing protein n=1 Tax=Penicillium argentinense TaxID=1131581 RepID=A0A9W9K1E5_9EURO|nr:multicopper oxidase-domain-containing protein [Penicillium argentinense]KAJ5089265.1 multicopper oxidase-domain-containing protein [Penicillium argentinense]